MSLPGKPTENKIDWKPNKTIFIIFYFIKSETSDSFLNHFAYLKTLDFYIKVLEYK